MPALAKPSHRHAQRTRDRSAEPLHTTSWRAPAELGTLVTSRQKLEAQENENVAVSREFGRLGANDKVYKLIGPALMLQEQDEAKGNVQKRLELIKSEL